VEKVPTRYISSFAIEFISDFICYCAEKYGFSAEEVAILSLIASESTREIRRDAFVARNFGAEDDAFPTSYRTPVTVKFIHMRLGMSRETTRRKLEKLAERGLVRKTKRGFALPAQVGDEDYTEDLRKFMVTKLVAIETYMKRMPT
jgi:DNA-binding MarR family transcriptional regulator